MDEASIALAAMTPEEAREGTERVRASLDVAWETVADLYQRQGWAALGYAAWHAYCDAEFGARLSLPREERRKITATLRDAGMSTRAIGAALGVGDSTVQRDTAGAPNGAPAPDPQSVTGLDGKTYEPTKPRSEPEPEPQLPDRQDDADEATAQFDERHESAGIPSEDELLDAIERRKPGAKADVERTRARSRWSKDMAGVADIRMLDPDTIASIVPEGELNTALGTIRDAAKWADRVEAARNPGFLRVVAGGGQ